MRARGWWNEPREGREVGDNEALADELLGEGCKLGDSESCPLFEKRTSPVKSVKEKP